MIYDLGKMDLHEQKLKEVRLIPNGDTIKLEIVCEIEIGTDDYNP